MTKNDIVDFIGENRKKIWSGIILGSFIFVATGIVAMSAFLRKQRRTKMELRILENGKLQIDDARLTWFIFTGEKFGKGG